VYDALKAGENIETGVFNMGLAEDGVGVAIDDNNRDLVPTQMADAVEQARRSIIDGDVTVVSYYENDSCPALQF
ncbi:MAG: BMP family ABC transporter substrate-binding protein, partial [Ruegeria sp.]